MCDLMTHVLPLDVVNDVQFSMYPKLHISHLLMLHSAKIPGVVSVSLLVDLDERVLSRFRGWLTASTILTSLNMSLITSESAFCRRLVVVFKM